jgi:hypothetical protein
MNFVYKITTVLSKRLVFTLFSINTTKQLAGMLDQSKKVPTNDARVCGR